MWVKLHSIPLHAFHGVFQHEKEYGCQFELDFDLLLMDEVAADTDNLHDTVDYTAVYKLIVERSSHEKFNLLERWADVLATAIIERFRHVAEVTVRIRKFGAPLGGPARHVEIELTRSR